MTVPEVGLTYQFNNARALVAQVLPGKVLWREVVGRRTVKRRGKDITRTTPRWFFEKYATVVRWDAIKSSR